MPGQVSKASSGGSLHFTAQLGLQPLQLVERAQSPKEALGRRTFRLRTYLDEVKKMFISEEPTREATLRPHT